MTAGCQRIYSYDKYFLSPKKVPGSMQSPGDITVHNAVSAPKLRGFMMREGGREESGTNHIITAAEAHRVYGWSRGGVRAMKGRGAGWAEFCLINHL